MCTKKITLFARRTGQAYRSVSWEAPKHKDRYFILFMQKGFYSIGLHDSYLSWLVEVVSVALPGVVGEGVPGVGDVVVHRHRVEQHPGGQPRLHLLQACERCLTMIGTETLQKVSIRNFKNQ